MLFKLFCFSGLSAIGQIANLNKPFRMGPAARLARMQFTLAKSIVSY